MPRDKRVKVAVKKQLWLPAPPRGTEVCGGFDGSENDDWTVIKLETAAGLLFTPRLADGTATIWNPAQHGGRIPRLEIHDAWEYLSGFYRLKRVYCDPGFADPTEPTSWKSEIEMWGRKHGEDVFVSWQMNGSTRIKSVHEALVRFETDLKTKALSHDGCPVTSTHAANARKIPRGERYFLGKPSQHQKIDAIDASVLAHEAASDARALGWGKRTSFAPARIR